MSFVSSVSAGLLLAMAATLGRPGVAVPLYALDGRCSDARFPMLAGAWAIGCGAGGQIDRAVHVPDGREVRFEPPLDPRFTAAAAGEVPGHAVLVEVHDHTRVVDLSPAGAVDRADPTRLPTPPVAPPAADALHFAAALPDRVEALATQARVRPSYAARPAGWYPPALAWPWVAWVERTAEGDEDVMVVRVGPSEEPRLLAGGPGFQRHVVSDGHRLAWVDGPELVVWSPTDDTEQRLAVQTGFHAAPTLSGGVACWEARVAAPPPEATRHIDVQCSDGLAAAGPGDQLSPSRSGPWLMYRSGDHVWLRTAP